MSELTYHDQLHLVSVNELCGTFEDDEQLEAHINLIKPLGILHSNTENLHNPPVQSIEEMTKGLSPQLIKIIKSYPTVFQNPPYASQIPNQLEDMKIEVKNEANVKQRPLGRLSDMERKALKEFITELLNSGKI
ncbi:hypothetical protein HK096_011476 [Nowakowskiella sp. JEL0078]|nr:hypothetical protein HK096_011476 [Nowakowskiella sp. JEL0078]